jgi:hypothetical protein
VQSILPYLFILQALSSQSERIPRTVSFGSEIHTYSQSERYLYIYTHIYVVFFAVFEYEYKHIYTCRYVYIWIHKYEIHSYSQSERYGTLFLQYLNMTANRRRIKSQITENHENDKYTVIFNIAVFSFFSWFSVVWGSVPRRLECVFMNLYLNMIIIDTLLFLW